MDNNKISYRSFILGTVFAGLFAWYTVHAENTAGRWVTATQIPILPYMLLIASVLVVNPLVRLFRSRRFFTTTELMIVFLMGAVSSGVSTFGLASQLVPITSSLYNGQWNTDQKRWDYFIEPFVNESYFISEKGIRVAALASRNAEDEWREADTALRAARLVENSRARVAALEKELAAVADTADPVQRELKVQPLRHQQGIARRTLAMAMESWKPFEGRLETAKVVEEYPVKAGELKAFYDEKKTALEALEAKAFAKVKLFREGLPKEMRAIPGFLYVKGEGLDSYFYRIRRMRKGVSAAAFTREAIDALGKADAPGAAAVLGKAVESLDSIARADSAVAGKADLERKLAGDKGKADGLTLKLGTLRQLKRYAGADEAEELDEVISDLGAELAKLQKQITAADLEIRAVLVPQIDIADRVAAIRDELKSLGAGIAAAAPAEFPGIRAKLQKQVAGIRSIDGSLRRFCIGDVPWRVWLKPLALWMCLILVTYMVLMAFNVLIFRQWAHNEKLIYPLAELPTILSGADDPENSGSAVPALFKSPLFWAGFAISAGVVGWNLMVIKGMMPGAKPIRLEVGWSEWVAGSPLKALSGRMGHEIFFTLIGLSFLVPARISFSLWSFQIFYMVLLLVLVGLGLGEVESSFKADLTSVMNFRTAAGGGALMVFASLILWKCRKYLLCALDRKSVEGLEPDERKELRISSALFLTGSAALVAMLSWGMGANIWFSIFSYFIVIVLTIAMVRGVAEGGLLGFQCWFSPFHFIRTVFGTNKAWTSPSLFVPLVMYHYVLFWDIKVFIAPAMANALKVRDSLRMNRLRFHVAIAAGILSAIFIALATHLILSYTRGADGMKETWFYREAPTRLYDSIKIMAVLNPVDTVGSKYWMLGGALLMAAILFFRQRIFWIPHPIGLMMWVAPLMGAYWFSILLGWLFKSLVSKYGDKDTYARFRYLFIGLIVGELVMCLFGATLNRNYFY